MPNTFRPRGAPTAEPNAYVDSYNDWDLVHRGAMAPWGVYEKDGQTSAGFAWPSMITEPIEAGKRFLSPGGGFENLPNEQSTQDATTLLLSMYSGNALNPMARVPKGALATGAMKETEGLGNALRAYRGVGFAKDNVFSHDPDTVWLTPDPELASQYASDYSGSGNLTSPAIYPVDVRFKNPLEVDAGGSPYWSFNYNDPVYGNTTMSTDRLVSSLKGTDHDGLIVRNVKDPPTDDMTNLVAPNTVIAALRPNTVRSATTGEVLFSDTGKPSLLGSALAGAQGERPLFNFKFDPWEEAMPDTVSIGGSKVRYGPSPRDDGSAYINSLVTPESEAGKGQARALMEAMTQQADAAGVPLRLDAQAWEPRTDVKRLRNFYSSLGFVDDGTGLMTRNPLQGERGGIIAYHGSPHDFDRFDLSKIGTGEGAQAYGHGLYFAENEGVAKTYRDSLSADGGLGQVARGRLRQHNGDLDKTIEYLRGRAVGNADSDLPFAVNARQALAELEAAKARGLGSGHMYQVKINANPEDFLDWDKPLSQQSDNVKNALAPELQKLKEDYAKTTSMDPIEMRASEFYRGLADDAVSSANRLSELGVPGIRYLDAYSRGDVGTVSRNYVLNNDNLIQILRKYGWLPPALYAADAMTDSNEAQASQGERNWWER